MTIPLNKLRQPLQPSFWHPQYMWQNAFEQISPKTSGICSLWLQYNVHFCGGTDKSESDLLSGIGNRQHKQMTWLVVGVQVKVEDGVEVDETTM